MAHVQQQIRENSMELQDYLRELKDWESKAKAKDRMLRGGATSSSDASDAPPLSDASNAPPIRGQPRKQLDARESVASSEKVPGKSDDLKKVTKSAASHTYDYFKDKWDKFDVEKALAEADADSPGAPEPAQAPPRKHSAKQPPITSPAAISVPAKAKPTSSEFAFPSKGTDRTDSPVTSTLQSEESPERRKAPDAASVKEEGNRLFKAGRYAEALESYGRSLALSPTSVAYANRAMAALKLEKFREAQEDCTAAIALDGRYVKAFSRRGRARSHLGKWLEAAEDFEFALRLEPHNTELLKEYSAARTDCQREAKLSPSSVPLQIPVRKAPPIAEEKLATNAAQNARGLKAATSRREERSGTDKEQGRALKTEGVPAEGGAVGRNCGHGNGKVESGLRAGIEGIADKRSNGSGLTEVGGNGAGIGNGNGKGNCVGNGGRNDGNGNETSLASGDGNGNETGNAFGNGNDSGNGNGNGKGAGNGMEERRSETSADRKPGKGAGAENRAARREESVTRVSRAEDLQGDSSVRFAHRMSILDVDEAASVSSPDVATALEGHVSRSEAVSLLGANSTGSVEGAKGSPVGVSPRVDSPPRKYEKSSSATGRSVGERIPANATPRICADLPAGGIGGNVSNLEVTSDLGGNVSGDVSKSGPLAVASAAAKKLQRALAENVCAPRTAYEFEAQWKGFKEDTGAKARLLKTLQPAQLGPFFKESLQAPLLCDMLRVVAGELLPGDAAFAADLLEGLSTVPRFALTVMFIAGKDKQSLRYLWDTAATVETIPMHIRKRLAACRTKYRM